MQQLVAIPPAERHLLPSPLESIVSISIASSRFADGRLLRLLENIADPRCIAEEVDAFAVVWFALAFDMGDDIVRHGFPVAGRRNVLASGGI